MTAETLLEAANILRQRAEGATFDRWSYTGASYSTRSARHNAGSSATYVRYLDAEEHSHLSVQDSRFGRHASVDAALLTMMTPALALIIADWLEHEHAQWQRRERSLGAISVRAMSGGKNFPDMYAASVAKQIVEGQA